MRPVPLISFADAEASGYLVDRGFPIGSGWDETSFPSINDEHVYALEVSGHSIDPFFRKGGIIIVSPATPIRKGDRVVVKTKDGKVFARQLKRKNVKVMELTSFNPDHKSWSLPTSDILWIARIVWASQ
jgi:phage repressor protein C with HTH and peptisase S24 domain